MAYDHRQYPSGLGEGPGEMENEVYIDGTLYVDGVPVKNSDRKRRGARQVERKENPCATILRYVRSNLHQIISRIIG